MEQHMKAWALVISFSIVAAVPAAHAREATPQVTPPGEEQSTKLRMLEAGANMLQQDAPPSQMNVYLVGFHPMKEQPEHQMEAHHFCRQVNQDFAQCALFDGNTSDANLNGIEYIISQTLFEQLPQQEREFWHPHNYEIQSGQLVGPGLPQVAEQELMESKMNSYGKTWHVWNTGYFGEGNAADELPLGEPRLAWSFNRDGEARPGLVERMEERVGVDVQATREAREDLVELAEPQEGVNALQGKFERQTTPIPGVVDAAEARSGQ
jgi:hypothetical protein